MRLFRVAIAAAFLLPLAGCEDGGSSGETGTSTTTGTGTTETGTDETGWFHEVPDPCGELNVKIFDDEPNNTPEEAADACTVQTGEWGTAPPGCMPACFATIAPEDTVDFFVFATTDMEEEVTVAIQPEWSYPANIIDFYIYEVRDDGLVKPFGESVTSMEFWEGGSLKLPGGTKWLLEVRQPEQAVDPPQAQYGWWCPPEGCDPPEMP